MTRHPITIDQPPQRIRVDGRDYDDWPQQPKHVATAVVGEREEKVPQAYRDAAAWIMRRLQERER